MAYLELEISMHDKRLVHVHEAFETLGHDPPKIGRRVFSAHALDPVAELAMSAQLHVHAEMETDAETCLATHHKLAAQFLLQPRLLLELAQFGPGRRKLILQHEVRAFVGSCFQLKGEAEGALAEFLDEVKE